MAARKSTNKARSKAIKANASKLTQAAKTKIAKKGAKLTKKTAAAASTAGDVRFPNKAITSKQTKSAIFNEIAEISQVSRKDVKTVFAAIRNVIERHVMPKGSGEVTIPELGIKVRRVSKKATKARMGRNPFTGEEIQIPAKPARKSVKVTALKNLKAIIETA